MDQVAGNERCRVRRLKCVFLGLSITSAWGNGHATTYRALLKAIYARGHDVTFLERNVPWYESNREFDTLPYCNTHLYQSVDELRQRFGDQIKSADVVVVGSYVPNGIEVGEWITSTARGCRAFYDIDTPITVAALERGDCEYLSYELIPKYDLYLSFTSGPILKHIERHLGSPSAQALYCSVDPDCYFPGSSNAVWDLGYLGTYSSDRQAKLNRFLLEPAKSRPEGSFVVAGSQYPPEIVWPANVERIQHLPPAEHRSFYTSQRFTLNLTRGQMVNAGFSPSVRLFEASACGTPILTDHWEGIEIFFTPGREILTVSKQEDVLTYLQLPEDYRLKISQQARERTLEFHTSAVRAEEFEAMVSQWSRSSG